MKVEVQEVTWWSIKVSKAETKKAGSKEQAAKDKLGKMYEEMGALPHASFDEEIEQLEYDLLCEGDPIG